MKVSLKLDHELSNEELRARIQRAFARYGDAGWLVSFQWRDTTSATVVISTIMEMKITIELELQENVVVLEADVPIPLMPFKKRVLELIEGEARSWIGGSVG